MQKIPELRAGMVLECQEDDDHYYILAVPTQWEPEGGGYRITLDAGKLMIDSCYAGTDPDDVVAVYDAEGGLFDLDGLEGIISGDERPSFPRRQYRIWSKKPMIIDPFRIRPGAVVKVYPDDRTGIFYMLIVEQTSDGALGYEVTDDGLGKLRAAKDTEITKLWYKHAPKFSEEGRWPTHGEIRNMIDSENPDWES